MVNSLKVSLEGALASMPLDQFQYELVLEMDPREHAGNEITSTVDDSGFGGEEQYDPLTPLVPCSLCTQTAIPPFVNRRVRVAWTGDVPEVFALGFNGRFAAINATDTAEQIEEKLWALNTVEALRQHDAEHPGAGPLPGFNEYALPPWYDRGVKVFGKSLNYGAIEVEFSGQGLQGDSGRHLLEARRFVSPQECRIVTSIEVAGAVTPERNEVQTLRVTGQPRSGTFRLRVPGYGDLPGTFARNATGGDLTSGLQTVPGNPYGVGDFTTTGGPADGSQPIGVSTPQPATPITIAWRTGLQVTVNGQPTQNLPQLEAHTVSLNNTSASVQVLSGGGYTGTLVVREVKRGTSANHWDEPINWSNGVVPSSGDRVVFDDCPQKCLYGLRQVDTFRVARFGNPSRFRLESGRSTFRDGQKVYIGGDVTGPGQLPTGLPAGFYYVRTTRDDATFALSTAPNGGWVEVTDRGDSAPHRIAIRDLDIVVYARWPGRELGLKRYRDTTTRELLPTSVVVEGGSAVIGAGDGVGPDRCRLDFFDRRATIEVLETNDTGDGADGVPGTTLLTRNAQSTIVAQGGTCAIAPYDEEQAEVNTIEAGQQSRLYLGNILHHGNIDVYPQTIVSGRLQPANTNARVNHR